MEMGKPLFVLLGVYALGALLSASFPRWPSLDFRSWERAVFKRSEWGEILAEARKYMEISSEEFQKIFRAITALTWPYWVPGAIGKRVALRARARRIRSFRRKAARCRDS